MLSNTSEFMALWVQDLNLEQGITSNVINIQCSAFLKDQMHRLVSCRWQYVQMCCLQDLLKGETCYMFVILGVVFAGVYIGDKWILESSVRTNPWQGQIFKLWFSLGWIVDFGFGLDVVHSLLLTQKRILRRLWMLLRRCFWCLVFLSS
mgnify:CR=1 FL=1